MQVHAWKQDTRSAVAILYALVYLLSTVSVIPVAIPLGTAATT